MTQLIILVAVVVIIVAGLFALHGRLSAGDSRHKYQYEKKRFFLSRAEHECYDALMAAVGSDFHIFAQVHLPTLIDNKVVGQNWKAAFQHINGKSVDFVLCDKAYIAPKLAIELDDKTHARLDRQERDREVERILKEAGMPLLRLSNHGRFDPGDFRQRIWFWRQVGERVDGGENIDE